MMMFSPSAQTSIMICSYGIYHICIHIQVLSQLHALPDDCSYMIQLVSFVKIVVTRQNVFLDICFECGGDSLCHVIQV